MNLIIIIDKLNKRVIFKEFKEIIIEVITEYFIRCFYRYYSFFKVIISDRRI